MLIQPIGEENIVLKDNDYRSIQFCCTRFIAQ